MWVYSFQSGGVGFIIGTMRKSAYVELMVFAIIGATDVLGDQEIRPPKKLRSVPFVVSPWTVDKHSRLQLASQADGTPEHRGNTWQWDFDVDYKKIKKFEVFMRMQKARHCRDHVMYWYQRRGERLSAVDAWDAGWQSYIKTTERSHLERVAVRKPRTLATQKDVVLKSKEKCRPEKRREQDDEADFDVVNQPRSTKRQVTHWQELCHDGLPKRPVTHGLEMSGYRSRTAPNTCKGKTSLRAYDNSPSNSDILETLQRHMRSLDEWTAVLDRFRAPRHDSDRRRREIGVERAFGET